MRIVFILIFFVFCFSCKRNDKKQYKLDLDTNFCITPSILTSSKDSLLSVDNKDIQELMIKVMDSGDIQAYRDLDLALMEFRFKFENLLYAQIMADKYNYTPANVDVYMSCIDIFSKTQDSAVLEKGFKYLKRGADLGYKPALSKLGFAYLTGEYIERDTLKAKLYLSKYGMFPERIRKHIDTWDKYKESIKR